MVNGEKYTSTPKFTAHAPIRVAFVLFRGFQPIDLSGPWQAFTTANAELGYALYLLTTCSIDHVVETIDGGLRVMIDHTLDASSALPFHTVIVPGGDGVHVARQNPAWLHWLRHHDQTASRMCSVCTGAFLLAASGLLDGQRVTTHWRSADRLRGNYPMLKIEDDRIYLESGKYWTSAGVTAGIDLALALVERDCGKYIAQRVARRLVVYLRRPGDQRQYSQTLRLQDRAAVPFRRLIEKLDATLAARWTVDAMAAECNMSRRTFQRKFKETFGISPTEALASLREERASSLLATGKLTKKELAREVGTESDKVEIRNRNE
jgi:transcriptional regulator GlxA family with amidase domain